MKKLSNEELQQFTRLVKDHEQREKHKDQQQNVNRLMEDRDFLANNFRHQKFLEDRFRLLNAFHINIEDQKVVNILNSKDYPDKEYLGMFYIMTAFDHQAFVDKSVSVDGAVRDKFFYILGADIKEDIELESQKSVFYVVTRKIYDFMFQATLRPDYPLIELFNHYLSIIGALAVAVPYEKTLMNHSFTMGINPNKTGNKYCLLIPPQKMEDPLFKDLYDFYHKNVVKTTIASISNLQYKRTDNKVQNEVMSRHKKLDVSINHILETGLTTKLNNLRQKGGGL